MRGGQPCGLSAENTSHATVCCKLPAVHTHSLLRTWVSQHQRASGPVRSQLWNDGCGPEAHSYKEASVSHRPASPLWAGGNPCSYSTLPAGVSRGQRCVGMANLRNYPGGTPRSGCYTVTAGSACNAILWGNTPRGAKEGSQ